LFPDRENGVYNFLRNNLIPLVIVFLIIFVVCQTVIMLSVLTTSLATLSDMYELHLVSMFWLSIAAISRLISKRIPPQTKIDWLRGLLILIKRIAIIIFAIEIFTNLLTYLRHPDHLDIVLFFYALGPAMYLIFWKLPNRHLAQWSKKLELKDYLSLENSVRTTFIQIVGGVLVLLGLYFTSQNIRLTLERTQLEELNQATIQLDSSNAYTRLLAIKSLERLADASWDNYKLIREILVDYLKGHTDWTDDPAKSDRDHLGLQHVNEINEILTFLVRRPLPSGVGGEQLPPLDLRGIDLRGLHLEDTFWNGAILGSAHLEGAHLNRAVLTGVDFSGSNLEAADLRQADLSRAEFDKANLNNAQLDDANLWETNLEGAQISEEQIQSAKCYFITTKLPPHMQCKSKETAK
jgi:uncharacterized protein YjbI with pentapeptide repeats